MEEKKENEIETSNNFYDFLDPRLKNLFVELQKCEPTKILSTFDANNFGLTAVMNYLDEVNYRAIPTEIAKHLNVSTARIAFILKKLEKRGFIRKVRDKNDNRVVVVKLTKSGKEYCELKRRELIAQINLITAKLGAEKIENFLLILKEIYDIRKENEELFYDHNQEF